MNTTNLINQIKQNAQKLVHKHALIHETLKNRASNPKPWEDACNDFHASYNELAFPGGLEKAIGLLKNQDAATISVAIIYLQTDPYFHRSGYIKQRIIRLIKKATLSQEQIEQLQEVVLDAIQHNGRREFDEYYRLARKIQNAEFVKRIETIVASAQDMRVMARAQQTLDHLKK